MHLANFCFPTYNQSSETAYNLDSKMRIMNLPHNGTAHS